MASEAAPEVASPAKPSLRLLSLDGGGVRGLSELLILQQLMLKMQKEKNLPAPPKPCEVFDLICGTSTGGIIALMLGRLRMTVDEAIGVYCNVSLQIFGKPKKYPAEGKFSATKLEKIMKETVEKFGEPKDGNGKADPEMRLSETQAAVKDCRVFVCCRNARATNAVRLFRSYPSYSVAEYGEMSIWQAARTTSAAPTFFKRLKIGPPNAQEEFLDGGLGSNNPTKIMMHEVSETFEKTRNVACVISIGAGVMDITDLKKPTPFQKKFPTELAGVLRDMVTDCEGVEKEVSRWFTGKPRVYFRFNVERGLEDIKLGDAEELGNIRAKTIHYLEQDGTKRSVAEAISVLCNPSTEIPISDLSMTISAKVVEPQTHLGKHKQRNFDELRQHSLSHDCLKSLAFPEMNIRSNHIESAAEGTCEWLLRHEKYERWAARDRGLFWIKGKPGSGKSTLLRYAFDNVKKAPSFRDGDLVLAFFFHGRGNELQKTPLGLFRSLLHQILYRVPDALLDLVTTFYNWVDTIQKPGEEYQWQLAELQRFLRLSLPKVLKNRPVWLFIDAIDECGEEKAVSIFQYFKSLLQTLSPNDWHFGICFTCRHYPNLDTGCANEICLEQENEQDISTYVQEQLSGCRQLTTFTIPPLIEGRAKGIFMWARLVVNSVLSLERKREGLEKMKQKIDATPPDLDELYNDLVRSMEDKPTSLTMFRWICFARRPLTLDELRWAMIVDPGCQQRSLQKCRNIENYGGDSKETIERINALSYGLAETVPSSNTLIVQFIHQTVQDFFVDKGLLALDDSLEVAPSNLSSTSVDKDSLIVGQAHYQLSRTCIRYLAMEEIAQSTISNRAVLVSAFPLLDYAATSWVVHVQQSEAKNVSQNDLLSYLAWPSESLLHRWAQVHEIIAPGSKDRPDLGIGMIHVMAQYSLTGPLQVLLQEADQICANINARDSEGWTPLSHAVYNGHETAVKLLLERNDIEADVKDKWGETPLSWAAARGHETVVRLLLERDDVKASVKDKWGQTPLSCAAQDGRETVVRLLLERHDVEADSKDKWGQTPLSCAAQDGRETVVRLLLERHDVEADSKDESKQTPLSYAARCGHETVVRLLLERNDVNADSKDKSKRTPLSRAAARGDETVVRLLLKRHDVEADSKDKFKRTPLSHAAYYGHETVAELLLERDDVKADVKDKWGQTPLSLAAMGGEKTMVKLLLERNDVEAGSKDEAGRTPLSYAKEKGWDEVVELLSTVT